MLHLLQPNLSSKIAVNGRFTFGTAAPRVRHAGVEALSGSAELAA